MGGGDLGLVVGRETGPGPHLVGECKCSTTYNNKYINNNVSFTQVEYARIILGIIG